MDLWFFDLSSLYIVAPQLTFNPILVCTPNYPTLLLLLSGNAFGHA